MSQLPPVPPGESPKHFSVGALLVDRAGRYLMQQRDLRPELIMAGHWALFGGTLEAGEAPRDGLFRELLEELEFRPGELRWDSELVFSPELYRPGTYHKTFFVAEISDSDVARMRQHEGAAMKFVAADKISGEPVVPWDAYAVTLHAARQSWRKEHEQRRAMGLPSPYTAWLR
ncbi:MAG: NUDIX domain-containing protein [Proteobacteria bacterium]|nr:NUDIX domain-containing protein [Pseudomonadota bacterium]